MAGRFQVIYSDPPWSYQDKGRAEPFARHRGVENHYRTMDLDAIKRLPVPQLAADDCALFLWCCSPLIREALETIEAWGFKYKTIAFTWVKTNRFGAPFCGLGRWTRSSVELCLLATRGKPHRVDAAVRQAVLEEFEGETLEAQRMRHSQKPAEVRERIVRLMGDVPRLEMFARERAPGWISWGNEVPPP